MPQGPFGNEPFVLITPVLLAASVAKKAAPEDTVPEPEALGTAEDSQGPPLDPGTQVEKKTLEISLGSQLSRDPEKTPNAEKVVEESQGADQLRNTAPQEGLRARTEAMLLHEMVRWTLPALVTNGTI